MALADNGILGSFTGKVGTVVGVRWRDKNVMRSKPKKTRHEPSEKQLAQRSKMGLVSSFLKPLRPITDRYFGQPEAGKSRADLSLSYHLTNALTGSHPDLSIDFKKVIVTKGELPGIYGAEIVAEADGRVRLS
ncbi:MAG: hypothetical protein CFE23_15445 [Flavobacterium sp. BFFFF1]|nr:MAG: hypothetical protein CFE23_15445 [Flavobacterium sp. BFFFF1]